MALSFKYVRLPREDKTLRDAPFISIGLRNKDEKLINMIALLDSGADYTVISKDISEFLGLKEFGDSFNTAGIGGEKEVRKAKMTFEIKHGRQKHQLTVITLVLQDPESDIPIILGRHGFFEHFHITFKQNRREVSLKKVEPKRNF